MMYTHMHIYIYTCIHIYPCDFAKNPTDSGGFCESAPCRTPRLVAETMLRTVPGMLLEG